MSAVVTLRNRVRSSIRRALRGNEIAHNREVGRAALKLTFVMPWGRWNEHHHFDGHTLPYCGR
jgi:hypothetical protein